METEKFSAQKSDNKHNLMKKWGNMEKANQKIL